MDIGNVIKKSRRERDMTQEQLAEYLNISVSAVSQWESGKTAPDISAIPGICRVLGITSDALLGIDIENDRARVEEIIKETKKYSTRGYNEEAQKILEDGLREFPNSFELIGELMSVFFLSEQYDKGIKLGERILEECTNDHTRHQATQVLCYMYKRTGEKEKAWEMANTMPTMYVSNEFLTVNIAEGTEKHRLTQTLLFQFFDEIIRKIYSLPLNLDDGTCPYTDDEKIELFNKVVEVMHILFEDGDYGFLHTRLCDVHQTLSYCYSDAEMVLHHLNQAADHAISFIEFVKLTEFTHTSLILRGFEHSGFSTNGTDNTASDVLEAMKIASAYDFIRDDPRFGEIEAKLAKYAGKWEKNDHAE